MNQSNQKRRGEAGGSKKSDGTSSEKQTHSIFYGLDWIGFDRIG